ncbi:outer membrane channel protein TolC [Shewanella sp. 1_MG-2023]|uniref:Outer membrane channel protein TolC n=1 Tax=Shewanella electrodiphila TaxID=934143 RepID=A0ABT0KPR8_9GAMM|nr:MULTISPECIES: outer membrane channel protein TolC [Shewanella]MCC4834093.1 outer membrane channel protein TolC [Shewanella sp. 10N.7]MCL1045684.1 outer membrane channel protein TolC [Shewanella electrodiphila]MDO6613458.1 outer membrane channel protein TolC [Shewanella sp. 7_MG-2023]MDO6773288.1 outer membrane channel protein TolC [Shewanella sp. 2_MG-2023]MDO6795939.1 outer membrane channel protein TolC [Shewanella sp. 1_MG-2023]
MKFKIRSLYAALTLAVAAPAANADDLLQIYQQALTSDTIVLQAQSQRDALYETIEENRAPLLPTISANVGYAKAWNDIDDGSATSKPDGFTGGLSLNQVIYDHSAWVGLDLAEMAASQADSAYASALQALIIRVTTAYFDVLTAKDNFEFQGAEKRAIERQLEQTKQRFAVGLTAITDVHEAQAQYDLASATEILAENTLANSYEALREITGIDHKSINTLDTNRFSAGAANPTTSSEWLKIAETNSIDLMTQRIGRDIASETISLYKAGHMPSLNFGAGYTKGVKQTGSADYDNANIALTLSVPIFEGFKVTSQVKQAQFQYVEASEKLEQVHRGVVKDVRNNFNNVGASISSIRAYEQSVISSESALKATQAGFEVGTRTIVDVLNRTRDLYDSKRQLSDARYGYINSILALKQAAGTLSEDDIISINNGLIAQ